MPSTLFIHGVPVECINQAAVTYYVPAKVIISVLQSEGGWAGLAKKNRNGTYDLGNMQINTTWLSKLRRFGISREQVQDNPCINVAVGAWILSQNIASGQNWWQGIGDYHSHTPTFNYRYQQVVYHHYATLQRELRDA